MTDTLLREGIDAFVVPMNKLLEGIEAKREAIVTGRPASIESDLPPELEGPVAARIRRATEEDVVRRIWRRDGTLWAPEGTPELTDRLGWLDIADKLAESAGELEELTAEVREAGYTDAVLLGMGGSSLAPEVFRRSFGDQGGLRLHVTDSTHPAQIQAVADEIDLERTLFIVSSKSGGTIETMSQFKFFHERQGDGAHYVAVTDPGHVAGQAGRRARLPPRVRERPGDRRALLGAVVLRARPGRAGGDRRRRRARDGAGRRGDVQARGGQRRACGWARRSASWRCRAATS